MWPYGLVQGGALVALRTSIRDNSNHTASRSPIGQSPPLGCVLPQRYSSRRQDLGICTVEKLRSILTWPSKQICVICNVLSQVLFER